MAFVFEEQRNLKEVKKGGSDVGPGYYEKSGVDMKEVFQVVNSYKCTGNFMHRQSHRNKSQQQVQKQHKDKQQANLTPGPGHYYIKGGILYS